MPDLWLVPASVELFPMGDGTSRLSVFWSNGTRGKLDGRADEIRGVQTILLQADVGAGNGERGPMARNESRFWIGVGLVMLAAIYARQSTEQNDVADEQKSVARQVENARAFAATKGWTVADEHVYVDDGIGGAETSKLISRQRLLGAISAAPAFRVLIMRDASRFSRRDGDEAFGELKRIAQAGVAIWFYQDGTQFEYGNFAANITGIVRAEMNAEFRRQIGRWTREAMVRKAKAGHVTGGACFGYRNIEIVGTDGRRSHVERTVEPVEAEIVRRIFRLSAEGHGTRAIAKLLNAEGAQAPRAQRGRSQSWAPTSVYAVLRRPLYRGEIVWAQTAKRDKRGQKRQNARPETEWIRRPAPALRIVTDDEWRAAHRQLEVARAQYLTSTGGRAFGRPARGNPSKYLLTNLALCGDCGGALWVRSRSHGTGRKFYYGCSVYHGRGEHVCRNGADVPMDDANEILIEALLDDVLDETMLTEAADGALRLIQGDDTSAAARVEQLEAKIETVSREQARLVSAIAAGGDMPGLVSALRERETRRTALEMERQAIGTPRPRQNAARIRSELLEIAHTWRRVLTDDPSNARPIVSALLIGRVTYTPLERKRWKLAGQGTLAGLFERELTCSDGVPNGIRTRVSALKGPCPGPLDDGDARRANYSPSS